MITINYPYWFWMSSIVGGELFSHYRILQSPIEWEVEMRWLLRTSAPPNTTDTQLRRVAGWAWTDEAMQTRLDSGEDIAFCDHCIRLEYPDRNTIRVVPPDMAFEDMLFLDLGGIHVQLLHVGGCRSVHTHMESGRISSRRTNSHVVVSNAFNQTTCTRYTRLGFTSAIPCYSPSCRMNTSSMAMMFSGGTSPGTAWVGERM